MSDLKQMQDLVGVCPKCRREITWFNNIPLTAYCWGTEAEPHKEWRKIVPNREKLTMSVDSVTKIWNQDDSNQLSEMVERLKKLEKEEADFNNEQFNKEDMK